MRKNVFAMILLLAAMSLQVNAEELSRIPYRWKWISRDEVAFTYDGSYKEGDGFVFNVRKSKISTKLNCPDPCEPYRSIREIEIEEGNDSWGGLMETYSPDSSKVAFINDNDLSYYDFITRKKTRLTFDGSKSILNGTASWVYYEEIFGRSSNYKAFWWSPDGSKIAFYRFDESEVGQLSVSYYGHENLYERRYPRAGEKNPEVRIGIIDLDKLPKGRMAQSEDVAAATVWADFDETEDQYFGTPFWGKDSRGLFVSREPRTQNTLDLYCVSVDDGSKKAIYHEEYPTWLDWMDEMLFTEKGLYIARAFETGWQQIYFLSYDGKTFERLTDGPNWNIHLLAVNEFNNEVYFTAKRISTTRQAVYKTAPGRKVVCLTDPAYNATRVTFSPDYKYFVASCDNARTPPRISVFPTGKGKTTLIADAAGPDFDPSEYCLPQEVFITTEDGFRLPGLIMLPKDLDTNALAKYPVHFEVYGGPDTPYVRDVWRGTESKNTWFPKHGIIHLTVDPRTAGHNGRAGEDMAYKQLTVYEIQDYIAWAKWITSFKYVNPAKVGVEGFSFGGTTTCMLLCQANEWFHYGIAGGGVYDWTLYDTHYTERFMDTPQNNPEGYKRAKVMEWIKDYPVEYYAPHGELVTVSGRPENMLKLTHGTADDNVYVVNTFKLVELMQEKGKMFELMLYPDASHGYKGMQAIYSTNADREFWERYLLDK